MHSREQYLDRVREEYRKADKRNKTRLLNEARKRTGLNRKVLIGKLAHPATPEVNKKRGPRAAAYGSEVLKALIKVWEVFDYPCGQRLAPALRQEVERMRKSKNLVCSDEVSAKLLEISPKTIDRLLAREKRVRCLRRNRNPSVHPLLYQKIPVKVASEWDQAEVGNLQLDYVAHCGRSTAGEFVHTLSAADIATAKSPSIANQPCVGGSTSGPRRMYRRHNARSCPRCVWRLRLLLQGTLPLIVLRIKVPDLIA